MLQSMGLQRIRHRWVVELHLLIHKPAQIFSSLGNCCKWVCIVLGLFLRSEKVKVSQSCPNLCDPMDYIAHRILQVREWVGSLSFLQGFFPVWVKPRSPAFQVDSLPAEPQGKPKNTEMGILSILQWSSQPRNWTGVSCIAGGFFTNWAISKAYITYKYIISS